MGVGGGGSQKRHSGVDTRCWVASSAAEEKKGRMIYRVGAAVAMPVQ